MAKDNTLIFYKKKFHWSWFIPVDDEVVSLGWSSRRRNSGAQANARRIFPQLPADDSSGIARRTEEIEFVEDVRVIPNYSYQVRGFCGKGFICIGDAHRFIDPIFSFGISATLREAEFAVPHVVSYLQGRV